MVLEVLDGRMENRAVLMNEHRQYAAGEMMTVGAIDGESLQDRFLRFRKERQRERALTKLCAKGKVPGAARDAEGLRRNFVDACKSYLGVPYAKRCHEPDDPDIDSPLFLDCCGLVRRAVKDLQEDFGFLIGRWNQAYQFETLPEELTFEQMRPGDLVFVEGKYYAEKKMQQRHFIVHVEVFVGGETGEGTIGSRWSRSDPAAGKVRGVQMHPSYRYTTQNYDLIKYHFRSLDTWLNGICKSQTYSDALYPTVASHITKSVFDSKSDDEAASDNEEEAGFVPNPHGASPVFYVVDGNNWKALAQVLERRGWQRLPFESSYTHRFDLKWVETRGQIDYGRHIEGQLVNHIPNNEIITAKTRLVETLRAHESATGEQHPWAPTSFVSERPSERLAALAEAKANPEAIWILKPSRGLGGKGIEFVRGCAALRERLFPASEADCAGLYPLEGWVVQRYIERPLLLQGRKFDMRAYCLVARTEPHLWFFHPGYCKVALDPYDLTADLSSDGARFSHLTNACVQRTHPDYRTSHRGQHIWSEAAAETELSGSGRWPASEGPFWPTFHDQMKRVMAHLFRASLQSLERRRGYFDLLGFDFMFDESFGLHLLEVNSNPAMFFYSSPTLEELVPRLLGSSIDLVLAAQRPDAGTVTAPAPFELVVDEASDFCYGR